MENSLEELCIEYAGQIALEWNSYINPFVQFALSIKHGKDYDINKKVEELAEKLRKKGYNLPVVATTDLHASKKKHLDAIGTSRIITDVKGWSPSEILENIKDNIFVSGDYRNVKKYVTTTHFIGAFLKPYALRRSSG